MKTSTRSTETEIAPVERAHFGALSLFYEDSGENLTSFITYLQVLVLTLLELRGSVGESVYAV